MSMEITEFLITYVTYISFSVDFSWNEQLSAYLFAVWGFGKNVWLMVAAVVFAHFICIRLISGRATKILCFNPFVALASRGRCFLLSLLQGKKQFVRVFPAKSKISVSVF